MTLELAVSGTPMVVAYRADALARSLKFLLVAPSVVLPNLVLGENVLPELLNTDCSSEKLAGALLPLLRGGPERDRQMEGLAQVQRLVREEGEPPRRRAAKIVLAYAEAGRQPAGGLTPQRASIEM